LGLSLTTTTTTEVKLRPTLKLKLLTELHAYAKLDAQVKGIKEEMEQRKAKIARFREEAGVSTLQLEGFHVTRVEGATKRTLNPLKLVEMGVTTDMLEEATVDTPIKGHEKITCPRAKAVTAGE